MKIFKSEWVELTNSFRVEKSNQNDYNKGCTFVLSEGNEVEILHSLNGFILCRCTKGSAYGTSMPSGGEFILPESFIEANEDYRLSMLAKEELISEMYTSYQEPRVLIGEIYNG